MPLYDYECEACGHAFEMRQSFNAEPVAACPVCHVQARRRFHPVGIIFKGSGWYVNDHGRKNRRGASDGEGRGSETDSQQKSTDSAGESAKQESPKQETPKQETTKQETTKQETGNRGE